MLILGAMCVDHYRFARILIAGRGDDSDIIVRPDHVQPRLWRREGHHLPVEDLETVPSDLPHSKASSG
jgi:hypothetical protein